MASLDVVGSELVVRLSLVERVAALHSTVTLPLTAVADVQAVDNPWSWLRGVRMPGTGLPGRIALGTWRGKGVRDFLALYGNRPAVIVDLSASGFTRLLVSTSDPDPVAASIRGACHHLRR